MYGVIEYNLKQIASVSILNKVCYFRKVDL